MKCNFCNTYLCLQIVFPNGSIDPWHALGITKDVSATEQAIFIKGKYERLLYILGHKYYTIFVGRYLLSIIFPVSCDQNDDKGSSSHKTTRYKYNDPWNNRICNFHRTACKCNCSLCTKRSARHAQKRSSSIHFSSCDCRSRAPI